MPATANELSFSAEEALLCAELFQRMFPRETWERWEFAGSLRRKKRDGISDIDHVIIPRFADVRGDDLFASPVRTNLLFAHLDKLVERGELQKFLYNGSPKWGPIRRVVAMPVLGELVKVDVYSATPDTWGPLLTIRTGPGEFSKMLVNALVSRGFRQKDGFVWETRQCPNGPHRDRACPVCEGTGLECVKPISCPDERAYFKLCRVEFLPPERRGVR